MTSAAWQTVAPAMLGSVGGKLTYILGQGLARLTHKYVLCLLLHARMSKVAEDADVR